jgi:hypothetical protein
VGGIRFRPGSVKLYKGEPKLFANQPGGPVARDLERRMSVVSGYAKIKVGVRTSLLLSTIRETGASLNARRWPHADVVAGRAGGKTVPVIHDQGSPPHVIRARRRKTLRFIVDGHVVFRTKVNHPGTKATGFLTESLKFAAG